MDSRYVLVTAARNEQDHIAGTLDSVVSQRCLPRKWVIVSDGSMDDTDRIVQEYHRRHPFIELVRRTAGEGRNFGSKAAAIAEAYERVSALSFAYVGVLDADVSFDPDYYEHILERMDSDERLGIAGGLLWDSHEGTYLPQRLSVQWSVSGPVQMFRRTCYEGIGGYRALKDGGIDAVAEVMARMNGWKVRTFPELRVLHHRRTGTEGTRILQSCVRRGVQDYMLGYHPLFFLLKTVGRMGERPAVLSCSAMMWGYLSCLASRRRRVLPPDFVRFFRDEQLGRLRRALRLSPSRQEDAPA